MGFRISGGKYYDPLTRANHVGGSTVLSVRPQAALHYSLAASGQLAFGAGSYSGNENSVIAFSVNRTGGAGGTIAVDWTVSGLTEGAPSPSTGTITWNSGESGGKSVNIQLGLVTANRTGSIQLSNPRSLSGGAAPTVPVATVALTVMNVANLGPLWTTVPDSSAGAGTFSKDVRPFVSDPENDPLVLTISPSSPTSLSQIQAAGLTFNAGVFGGIYNGATPLNIIVRATENTLEADWRLRSGQDAGNPQPGVVWFHDFRSDAEVNGFRFTGSTPQAPTGGGNDPGALGTSATLVRRITTDGLASGACLECFMPAGTSSANSVWWRPFSPLQAPGNGKATNDPGAGGTIAARPWNPTQNSSELANHDQGWYGNALYANADPTHFDGTEYYFQAIVKMDPRRITGGNAQQRVGKFIWFTQAHTASSFEPAEHVIWSYGDGGNQGNQNYLRVYVARAGGTDPLDDLDPGTRIQPGSDVAQDWFWTGGWDCVLFHVRPGQAGVSTGANATLLEIWAARQGETSYTKIWSQTYSLTNFPNGGRSGIQSFIGSAYNNNGNQLPGGIFPQAFFHRFAQIIFSKQFIPCPQAWS